MILKNSFSNISFGSNTKHFVLDVFFGDSGTKKIKLESDSDVCYVAVFDDASVDFDIDLSGDGSVLNFFGIFVGDIKSKILTSLVKSNTFANVNLFCVVKDDSDIHIDGSIYIGKNVSGVEGYLFEEKLLLGEPKNLFIRPVLDIYSNDVKASHAAKIHTLDSQKLFYMSSKGLSTKESQFMFVEASIKSIFDRILDVDEKEKQKIFQDLIKSVFISKK